MSPATRHLIVFEDAGFRNLLPLTYWRTVWELRVGYGSLLDHLFASVGTVGLSLYCREMVARITADRFSYPVNRLPGVEEACWSMDGYCSPSPGRWRISRELAFSGPMTCRSSSRPTGPYSTA